MIDGVPEVRDLIPTGEAIAQRDDAGRLVYRLSPEGQERITAALAARGIAAREKTAARQVTAILCGGEPSDHDRQVIAAFADALAIDDEHERRAAVLDLQVNGPRA